MAKKKSSESKKKDNTWLWIVAALVVIVVAISWCSSSAPKQPATQDQQTQETPPTETPSAETPTVTPEPAPAEEVKTENPEVTKYLARLDQVKSYSFIPAVYSKDYAGKTKISVHGRYYVYGQQALIDLVPTVAMSGWSADTVVLNYDTKTAKAYCTVPSCVKEARQSYVKYDDYVMPRPESWLDQIKYGTVTGRVTLNNRPAVVVSWQDNGVYYQAVIDTYYGMPMRVLGATDEAMTDVLTGIDYRSITFNDVKETDVAAPY